MKSNYLTYFCFLVVLIASACENPSKKSELPSWNNTDTKQSIINFVESVTDESNEAFIPIKDRIAVFDNDGNLWSEQPMYFQVLFAFDFIKKNAQDHPEWVKNPTLKAIIDNDQKTISNFGVHQLLDIVSASHGNMSSEQFKENVQEWLKTAKHPSKQMAYNKMIYQPMIELLEYLRANNFKTYIVSGGGVAFLRVWAEDAYGIPPEQIIGSSLKAEFVHDSTGTYIKKLGELNFLDDKEGKPIMINQVIGKKPVFCSGNSDGDLAMMQWTATNSYRNFNLLLHHTDAEREFAYDKESHVGKLVKALTEAQKNNWTVIDMKRDWKTIYSSN